MGWPQKLKLRFSVHHPKELHFLYTWVYGLHWMSWTLNWSTRKVHLSAWHWAETWKISRSWPGEKGRSSVSSIWNRKLQRAVPWSKLGKFHVAGAESMTARVTWEEGKGGQGPDVLDLPNWAKEMALTFSPSETLGSYPVNTLPHPSAHASGSLQGLGLG